MSWGEYLAGVLWFVGIWGASLAVGAIIVRRRLAHLDGAVRILAGALIATLALIAVHVVPACLTIMTRGTVLAASILALAGALLVRRSPAQAPPEPSPHRRAELDEGTASRVIAVVAVAAVLVAELTIVRQLWLLPPLGIDALNFHLPDAVGWMRSGSLWQVGQFTPDLANGNYPNNGNVILLASILPWHADFLVRFALLPFLALTSLAVYAFGRELGAPRSAATVFGACFAAIPAVGTDLQLGTLPDVVMTASLGTGLLFLVRHARTDRRSDLVLAGLGLGCAFGTKWFGATSAVAVVALWAAASLLARRGFRRVLGETITLAGLVAAAGGIWLVRNLAISGSPVFPAKLAPFGITIFDAPRDRIREIAGKRIIDFADDGHAWTEYFLPAWKHALGLPGAVLAVGAAMAIVLGIMRWRRPQWRRDGYRLLVCAAAACLLFAVYLATPYSAFSDGRVPRFARFNVRYSEPAFIIAASLAAWAAGQAGGRMRIVLELGGLVAVIQGLHAGLGIGFGDISKLALVISLVIVACTWSPLRARLTGRGTSAGLTALLVLVVGAVAYGHRFQHDYLAARYVGGPADEALTWITRNAPSGNRIGLVGFWNARALSPVYPAFGPRLGNEVAYVGPHIKHMLRTYNSKAEFLAGLRRGGYQLLVIGVTADGLPGQPRGTDYERWTSSAGWQMVASSQAYRVYRAPTTPADAR